MSPSKPRPQHSTRADLVAGLTVAVVGLPQCLAYAMMAGLPPAYGLSTAIVAGSLAALVGRSPQVITGPTNTTGLLILGAMAAFLPASGDMTPEALAALATLTLLAGLFRMVLALVGGHRLLHLLPRSVLVGFTAGAGILIGVMQLDEGLGLPSVRGGGLLAELAGLAHLLVIEQRVAVSLPSLALAVGTMGVTLAGRRLRTVPVALLAVALATLAAWALGLGPEDGVRLVRDRASVQTGWPATALPSLDLEVLGALWLPALSITLLGTLELAVTAQADGARPSMRREILAQGVANTGGAFLAAFPASASLSRSALAKMTGANTTLAAGAAALAVLPVLLFAAPAVGYVPQASLAGVLFATAVHMVDTATMARMWRTARRTRLLLGVTLLATLFLPLTWAILLGVAAGLVFEVEASMRPRVRLLDVWMKAEGPLFAPRDATGGPAPDVVVVEVSGLLHYAAVPDFSDAVRGLGTQPLRVVVDLSHAHALRFAALRALERLDGELRARGGRLDLAGVTPEFAAIIARTGSALCWTAASELPGESLRRCLVERCAQA